MKYLAVAASLLAAIGPVYADDLTEQYNRDLFAVIRWEILWGQLPDGVSTLPNTVTRFAVRLIGDNLSYCSHDLGVCESYRTGGDRNWEGTATVPCRDKGSDQDALQAFISVATGLSTEGEKSRLATPYGSERRTGAFVQDRSPTPLTGDSSTTWVAAATLGSRSEIIQRYRHMRSEELGTLQRWIRATFSEHGVKVSIPCFASSDPVVFLAVTGPRGQSDVETVFWDREARTWQSAGRFDPPTDPRAVAKIRSIVELVRCSAITF